MEKKRKTNNIRLVKNKVYQEKTSAILNNKTTIEINDKTNNEIRNTLSNNINNSINNKTNNQTNNEINHKKSIVKIYRAVKCNSEYHLKSKSFDVILPRNLSLSLPTIPSTLIVPPSPTSMLNIYSAKKKNGTGRLSQFGGV